MSEETHRIGDARQDVTLRPTRAMAVALATFVAFLWILGGAFLWLNRSVVNGDDVFLWALWTVTGVAYVGSALAIVRRQPSSPVGWLFFWIAGVLAISIPMTEYAVYTIRVSPGALPASGLVLALAEPTPMLALLGIVLVLQLFPDGRPVSTRWNVLAWLTVAVAALWALGPLVTPHRIRNIWSDMLGHTHTSAENPLGVAALRSPGRIAGTVVGPLIVMVAVLAITSLIVRRRSANATQRVQLRWLALVVYAAAIWIGVMIPIIGLGGSNGPAASLFWLVVTPLVALGPPIAVGIAIVRHRLFDIDVVINKTVVYGVLAVFITLVYVAIVVGFGALVGAHASAVLSATAAAVVALAFQPARRRAQRFADRLVYGKRATPYEILSEFSENMGATYATDDVLSRMADLLAGATGARSATVWLLLDGELRPTANAGDLVRFEAVAAPGPKLPQVPGDFTAEVHHQGETLGALTVVMPGNDQLDTAREKLVCDLASQAGLVLRNVRLIEELKASRQRLVTAQDGERRRLERNIHDGVQQQLVALAINIRLARQLADRDPEKVDELLERTGREVTETLEDLRDLARGIYPPLLAADGLSRALSAQASRGAVSVEIASDGIARYPQETEAAVYFCCLEALQNVAKYSGVTTARVWLSEEGGQLVFKVHDDGRGFDAGHSSYGTGLQGMADRLSAQGGTLEVRSQQGKGTTVIGRLPIYASSTGGADVANEAVALDYRERPIGQSR